MKGIKTFTGRRRITDIIENRLNELFFANEVEIVPFGVLNIVKDNEIFKKYFAKMEVNQKPSSMIVKFAPDYIILKKTEPQELYFLEVKCSVTPCWAASRVSKIKERHCNQKIDESNIGEIAREALLSYNRFFPNTIVLYGSSYNSKILMAQFADKIQCLYCYKQQGEYDCENCPSKNDGFFEQEKNSFSDGSQTANTNVNLDSFVSADVFFEQLGIHLRNDGVSDINKVICDYNVRIPRDKVDIEREIEIRNTLVENGCKWVDRVSAYYSALDNDFYHFHKNCFTLHGAGKAMYRTEQEAKADEKKRCKFCGQEIT
ncbi:MAG: hypothetical protein IJX86_00640 [Lachnospiraceae bacterium]|nr:hypothetical protein [Lachnospiraceae bacterium]